MGPFYDLSRVRAAAEMDRVRLGLGRCREHLLPYLEEILKCREFARKVAARLCMEDFIRTNHDMDDGPWDEYGVSLSDELAEEFSLEDARTWYLKLKIEGRDEDELFFVSFHRPEWPLRRLGGVLGP